MPYHTIRLSLTLTAVKLHKNVAAKFIPTEIRLILLSLKLAPFLIKLGDVIVLRDPLEYLVNISLDLRLQVSIYFFA